MSYKSKLGVSLSITLLAFAASSVLAADGYANVSGTTTGGAGGTTVTVTTPAAFISAVGQSAATIVKFSGTLNLGSSGVRVAANKSIIGVGASAKLVGDLQIFKVSNVIVQNVIFSNTGDVADGDGITMQATTHAWVDHCTFVDNPDGQFDITHGSDFVTVSWCKFYYTRDNKHDFVNLIGHSDSATAKAMDAGKLHVTMHHNWYGTLCKERMPRVRFGRVHCYNNYYGAAGNNYDVGIGNECQVLLENCYFDSQNEPWRNYSASGAQGLIHWNTGNVFVSTTIPTWAPNSSVFAPPYSYTLTAGSSVKSTVMAGAGVH